MNEAVRFHYLVDGEDFSSAGQASVQVKKNLRRLGIPPEVIRKISIAMYEGEINMVIHADGGEAEVLVYEDRIVMILTDRGPGIADVEKAIRPDTTLIAIMMANNEIGTIQPIKEIAAIGKAHGVTVFTDAVQAVGNMPVNVKELGVDMLSLSGHKIHAPKGIGVLYIRTGTRCRTLIDGGGQERGRRGGTENVAFAVALAKALEIATARLSDMARVKAMRDRLMNTLLDKIPYAHVNGDTDRRLAGNLNMTFECVEGESLLMWLDASGICASTGSACNSASLEPSHVLLSIGVPVEHAHGSLRFSLSHENTEEDVDHIIQTLPVIVQRLRDMSPLYNSTMARVKE